MEMLVPDWKLIVVSIFMMIGTCNHPSVSALNMPMQGTPTELHLNIPKQEPLDAEVISANLCIILLDNDYVYAYNNEDIKGGVKYTYSSIRSAILDEKKKHGKNFHVAIKQTNKAGYARVIDMLDEMTITNVKSYAIVDLSPAEIMELNVSPPK